MSDAARHLRLTLEARERGDVNACLVASAATQHHAEREREPDTGWRALTALGMLHLGRGEPEKARPWFGMALEHAKSHGLTRRVAGSAHDLFVTASDEGDEARCRHWAPIALELYEARDDRVHCLLVDFALAKLRKNEDVHHARQVLYGVHAAVSEPRDRLISASWLMVASALTGVRAHYQAAFASLSAAVQGAIHGECVAIALNRAVEAMLFRGDFERAYLLAGSAELAATRRGENLQRERAAYLREQANTGRRKDVARHRLAS